MSQPVRRTNLFLVELMVNLVVFSICAAVCVGLLLYARGMSNDSSNLTNAVYIAQSAAERYRDGSLSPAPILQTFDAEFLPIEGGSPSYTLGISPTSTGADIIVAHIDGTALYTLSVASPDGRFAP